MLSFPRGHTTHVVEPSSSCEVRPNSHSGQVSVEMPVIRGSIWGCSGLFWVDVDLGCLG